MDLTEDTGEDDDDDVQIIERPKEHAKQLQSQLNRFKGGARVPRPLNEIMRDHERRQSGVIDVDDDAALAQALQAREDTFQIRPRAGAQARS